MLQHIVFDLRVGCPILKLRHIHILQRELHPYFLRVDFSLGKHDNYLHMARLLQIDVKAAADCRVRSRKQVDALVSTIYMETHRFPNRLSTSV